MSSGADELLTDYPAQTEWKSSARAWLATPAAKAMITSPDAALRGEVIRGIMQQLVAIAQPTAGGEANWWFVVGFSEPGAKWLSLLRAMLKEGPAFAQADLADVVSQMAPMAGSVMGDKDPTPQVIDAVERSLGAGPTNAALKSGLQQLANRMRPLGNAAERRMVGRMDHLIAR